MNLRLPALLWLYCSIPIYSQDARLSEQVNAIHNGADAALVLHVVDFEGVDVVDADVWAGFACNAKGKSSSQTCVTDTNGLVVLKGLTSGRVNIRITKDGYYRTESRYDFGQAVPPLIDGKWQPWNATNAVVLKQIKNPIAMCVKSIEANLPTLDQSCSYDLAVGDWVTPFGKGERRDLVFSIAKKRVDTWTDFDGSIHISFDTKVDGFCKRGDGVVAGSLFAWAYDAPTNGYLQKLSIDIGYLPGRGYYETNQSDACYFRTRSITNDQGEITSANYGKILGPVVFDVRDTPTAWVKFTYYYNSTANDRNMEFDPKRNLFTDLAPSEQVNNP